MAASVTSIDKTVVGNKRQSVAEVTFDSSYPTGGESVTAAQLGLSKVDYALCNIIAVGGTVDVAEAFYDKANSKIKVFDQTPAEVANTADLSTLSVRIVAWGT